MGGPRGAGTVSRLFTTEHDDAIRTGVMTHGAGKWVKIQQGAECLADFTGVEISVRWRKVLNVAIKKGAFSAEEDAELLAIPLGSFSLLSRFRYSRFREM